MTRWVFLALLVSDAGTLDGGHSVMMALTGNLQLKLWLLTKCLCCLPSESEPADLVGQGRSNAAGGHVRMG